MMHFLLYTVHIFHKAKLKPYRLGEWNWGDDQFFLPMFAWEGLCLCPPPPPAVRNAIKRKFQLSAVQAEITLSTEETGGERVIWLYLLMGWKKSFVNLLHNSAGKGSPPPPSLK